MPKPLSLTSVSIWSEDLNNLLPFYRDVLGLPVRMETPGFVMLGPDGAPPIALGTHSEVRGRATDAARHIVSFETDDIAGEYARLRGKGVEFLEEPSNIDGGNVTFAAFKDPEGNLLQLVQFASPPAR